MRILIAESVPLVRQTLTALPDLEGDIQVAPAAASGDQVVPAALEHRPGRGAACGGGRVLAQGRPGPPSSSAR